MICKAVRLRAPDLGRDPAPRLRKRGLYCLMTCRVQRRPMRLTGPPRLRGVPGRTPTPRAPTPALATRTRVARTAVTPTAVVAAATGTIGTVGRTTHPCGTPAVLQ